MSIPPQSPEPLVSVALPVYNGSAYISASIEAVLAQTYANIELTIVDAGSTDQTEEICARYAEADARVTYSRAESYRGLSENHQAGLASCRGDYMCFVAADDAIAPTFVQECMDAHTADGNLVLVFATTAGITADWRADSCTNVDEDYADDTLELTFPRPSDRLTDLIRQLHMCNAFGGVYRTAVIRDTLPFEAFQGWDRVTLAAVVLRGRCLQLPARLQYRRVHHEQASKALHGARADKLFNRKLPEIAYLESVNLFFKQASVVIGAPLSPVDSVRCMLALIVRWPIVRRFFWAEEWRLFRERRAAR
jgi:glycosyltransferase involved in cell wall biosynthesis